MNVGGSGEEFSWTFIVAIIFATTMCVALVGFCVGVIRFRSLSENDRITWLVSFVAGTIALFSVLITSTLLVLLLRIEDAAQLAEQLVQTIATRTITTEMTRSVAIEVATSEARTVAIAEARRILEDQEIADNIETGTEGEEVNTAVLAGIIARRYGGAAHEIEDGVESIQSGHEREVASAAGETAQLQLEVESDATYIVEASAVSGDVDPYLYLYRDSGTGDLERVAVDDDGGNGFDSRLQRPLEADTYYLVIEDLLGRAGSYKISVSRIDTEG